MRTILRTINSPKLLGIEKDHFDHSGSAPMHSTGNLHQMREDETDLKSWFVEYKCEVCGDEVLQRSSDVYDIVRPVLKEAGIIAE